jgi:hypothetical protein
VRRGICVLAGLSQRRPFVLIFGGFSLLCLFATTGQRSAAQVRVGLLFAGGFFVMGVIYWAFVWMADRMERNAAKAQGKRI